jgi:hypothetical protein
MLKASIVLCTSEKSTAAVRVVVAPLLPPVKVSAVVKSPTGMVIAKEVAEGMLVIEQVAALTLPVMVSPTEKAADAPTVMVRVPPGYTLIPEATVILVWAIVHWFKPRFAHSANNRFNERFAVFRS